MNSSKKLKVVIDTNVFLSGILFGGTPGRVLTYWKKELFTLCLSPELKGEIIEKLIYKFQANRQFIHSVQRILDEKSDKYLPKAGVAMLKDKKDNFLLELAEESHANFLITGDKELLALKNYKYTSIVSPKEFLKGFLKK